MHVLERWLWRLTGGRRLPPMIAGYLAIILLAVGAILLLAGAASCLTTLEDEPRRIPLAVQTVVLMALGVGVMRVGLLMLGREEE